VTGAPRTPDERASRSPPAFETRELTVRYPGSARPALADVDFTVEPGTLYAILGPNGSGKSTLMRALLGVLRPTAGRAFFEGRNVRHWKRRELARRVGAVAQSESTSFPIRVRELVAMGRYPHLGALSREGPDDHAAIEASMERCDVAGLADREISTLSEGEAQRARIARALAQEPSALALDEPTSSLDIRHEMAILGLLKRSAEEGMAVLLVTHHLELAGRFADRLLLLSSGSVAAEGAPEDVLREETLTRVYGWPVDVPVDPETGHRRVVPRTRP